MNVLDENVDDVQCELLARWRIHFRRIGPDVGERGMKDDRIIPLLHRLRAATFFTRDVDFYDGRLCHHNYCIVFLDVQERRIARFIRRFLRQPAFSRRFERIGKVFRATESALHYWQLGQRTERCVPWSP